MWSCLLHLKDTQKGDTIKKILETENKINLLVNNKSLTDCVGIVHFLLFVQAENKDDF